MLRSYEHRLVYGLFQTESYARALLRTEEAVQNRLRRQGNLTREDPPTIYVVMDESVLHREVHDIAVMAEQLRHLYEISQLDNVILQIAKIGYYRDARAAFTIATQPDRSELVYLENAARGETSSDSDDLNRVAATFANLQANAMTPVDSRHEIGKVLEERWLN